MPGQSGPGSNGNEGLPHIPQGPSITRTSPSNCLVSYPGHSLGGSYPFAEVQSVYSTAPANWASENLARQTSSKDSITMNLRKSATSFSESDKFRLDFLFEDAIYAVYFSLALHITTYHRVQLVLGMNQGGDPFTLVEMGIHCQYT